MRARGLGSLALVVVGLLGAAVATAVDVGSRQTLDSVGVHTRSTIIDMQFDAQQRPPDFVPSNIVSATGTFVTCKLTVTRGLFCLDGDRIRRWPAPVEAATEAASFSCRGALASPRRSDVCAGLTVDVQGSIWIVGQKGNTHSVIKLVDSAGAACVAPSRPVPGAAYCATDFYSGRPPLVDVDPVEGDVATLFKPCPSCAANQKGVLALESRRDVTFFPDPLSTGGPVTVAPGNGWGLDSQETLLGTTLLQVGFGNQTLNYVLVTTSTGRILARDISSAGAVQTVFRIPDERTQATPAAACPATTPQYAIRSSTTSGTVYVTDRTFCQVLALRAVLTAPASGATQPTLALANITDPLSASGADLTLPTVSATAAYSPEGITVAPGVSVNLSECTPAAPCPVVGSAAGKPAAAIRAVTLQPGSKSGVTMFQVLDIPDCRYLPADPGCAAILAQQAVLEAQGKLNESDRLIVKLAKGTPLENEPATQMLNVKPLLPLQITSLYPGGQLPPANKPLLISNLFRGQPDRGHRFDAIYAIADEGVRFGNTFLFAFDVPLLDDPVGGVSGAGRRCQPGDGGRSLLDWDVMTRVSEKEPSVGGRHVDAMTNVDCENPSMSEEATFSMLPYTLEVVPDTWNGGSTPASLTRQNDAVFARLVQRFYADLESIRTTYVCPTGGAGLYSNALCSALASTWSNGKYKLDKCVAAAFQPKKSAGDENCNAFLSQLTNLRAQIPAVTPLADVANRTGELRSRSNVIDHVFRTRFLPSIPQAGFCRERTKSYTYCNPVPWPDGVER